MILKSAGDQYGPASVTAIYRARMPASIRQYDPSAPFADADGMVAAPNVDLAQEAVGILQASVLFKANLAVFKTAHGMTKRLLDISA